MNKALRIAMILASMTVFLHPVDATSVRGVMEFGQDGEATYYQIRCSDNTRGSVVVHLKEPKICAQPLHRPEQCRTNWSLQEASAFACK